MQYRLPFTFACCLAFAIATLPSQVGVAATKPNIVFINADDLTHRDLGCYGGQAHTPNIDRLAGEGVRFTHCFQAAPMCSPTRHNIYTGLYPVKSGAYPNHTFAKEGTKSVCHYLANLGYRVALSGKTHIAPRSVFPFEYSGKNNPDMGAIETLMQECKASGTPFCLFACSNEPHSPWDKGDASRYPPENVELPPYFVDTPEQRDAFSRYLAEITYYDDQVGQLLAMLKKHELEENTIVMVTSEQGNGFPFAKWTLYDSGLQTAMIARWPGKIESGVVSNAMIEYVDVLPTMIDAAQGEQPSVLEGKSFLPVLLGKKEHHKDHVYGIMTTRGIHHGSDSFGIRSVRSRDYKLILNFTPETKFVNACSNSREFASWKKKADAGDTDAQDKVRRYHHRPAVELYDVSKDWYEWENIAEQPGNAKLVAELRGKLNAWMKQQGDKGQQTELNALAHQNRNRNKKLRKRR